MGDGEKQSGYLVIADISGYTRFLHESELEPAAEHLRSFLDLLIQHTRPPLVISRLEGDAIISYALEGSFLQGQTLIDLVEDAYMAFRQTIELTIINNSCDCHACHNISKSTHIHVDNRIEGRVGPGVIYQCEYGGKATITQTIVTWEPFKQYTFESERPCWTHGHTTVQLTPSENGTTLSILVGKSEGGISLLRKVSDLIYLLVGRRQVQLGLNLLYDQMN